MLDFGYMRKYNFVLVLFFVLYLCMGFLERIWLSKVKLDLILCFIFVYIFLVYRYGF